MRAPHSLLLTRPLYQHHDQMNIAGVDERERLADGRVAGVRAARGGGRGGGGRGARCVLYFDFVLPRFPKARLFFL